MVEWKILKLAAQRGRIQRWLDDGYPKEYPDVVTARADVKRLSSNMRLLQNTLNLYIELETPTPTSMEDL